MYYIGLDVNKKTISYCVKDAAGQVHREGKIGSTRRELDAWIKTLPQPRTIAMEATIFTGWIYYHLLLHRIRIFPTHVCLSAGGPCIPAGPDIHLLSKTPKSPHRRLSLCSLPVPKQFEESLGSSISFAQSPNGRTWQPAHRINPDVFSFLGRFFHAAAVALNTSAGTKSCFLRSTARRYATIFLATASVARFAFPLSRSFS